MTSSVFLFFFFSSGITVLAKFYSSKKNYIYASNALMNICFAKHPDLKIKLVRLTPVDIMEDTAFTGFDSFWKAENLSINSCLSVSCWLAQVSTIQVPGSLQTAFKPFGFRRPECLKYLEFSGTVLYLEGSEKGNDQLTNFLPKLAWVPPAQCHITNPSQELLGLELEDFLKGSAQISRYHTVPAFRNIHRNAPLPSGW